MADSKAIRLLETLYVKMDQHLREVLNSMEGPVHTAEVLMHFDGGGSPLVAGLTGVLEIPFDCRIAGARMYVGPLDVASSATVRVRLGTYADYPSGTLLHGSGTIPTLTSAQKANLNISGWLTRLEARDVLSWELATFTGTAEALTLALVVRKVPTS